MLIFLLSCSYDAHFNVQTKQNSSEEDTASDPSSNEPEANTDTDDTDTDDTDTDDTGTDDSEESDTADPVSDEYLAEDAAFSLAFEESHNASMAHLWNYAAPAEDGFYFTTMYNKKLMLRAYDFDFNIIQESKSVATTTDLGIQHRWIADHATLYHNGSLYYAISMDNDWNLMLVSSDLEGTRIASTHVQQTPIMRCNDPQLFSVGDDICVRWGESGYEKAYRCFDSDLTPLYDTQIKTTTIPTSQLGSTIWTGEKFIVLSGDETQTDLIISQYDEDWNELEPFQQTIMSAEYREWNWASTGIAWIPEYELWAVAYTNMPKNGGGMDGRGRIALFNNDFELQTVRFTQQQDKATFRTHLIWHEHTLIVSYDAGPVIIELWDIIPL
jgi:hypothetical protein